MTTLAVDVIAQAIRINPSDIAAGVLAERYVKALHEAGYIIIKDRTDPEGGTPGREQIGEVS